MYVHRYNPVLGEFFRCRYDYPDGSRGFYIAEQGALRLSFSVPYPRRSARPLVSCSMGGSVGTAAARGNSLRQICTSAVVAYASGITLWDSYVWKPRVLQSLNLRLRRRRV